MDKIELAAERSRQARLRRLGTQEPRCGTCGESDDRCLELHHIAGRKNDTATAIVCRNCHRKLSDAQDRHPGQIAAEQHPLERIGHFLLGLADLLNLLIERLSSFGRELIQRAAAGSTNIQSTQP